MLADVQVATLVGMPAPTRGILNRVGKAPGP